MIGLHTVYGKLHIGPLGVAGSTINGLFLFFFFFLLSFGYFFPRKGSESIWTPNSEKYEDSTPKNNSETPLHTALCYILPDKGGNFKSCPRVKNLGTETRVKCAQTHER